MRAAGLSQPSPSEAETPSESFSAPPIPVTGLLLSRFVDAVHAQRANAETSRAARIRAAHYRHCESELSTDKGGSGLRGGSSVGGSLAQQLEKQKPMGDACWGRKRFA